VLRARGVVLGLAVGAAALGGFSVVRGQGRALSGQTEQDALRKSAGCLACHTQTDRASMHTSGAVHLGCTDCHGGSAEAVALGPPGSDTYREAQRRAHVAPRHPETWPP